MIFGKELARKVLDGSKTATRRPVRQAPQAIRPCTYKPGRDYAVQRRRGGREIARIQIDAVRREPLGTLSFADARAEGFRTTADFQAYWLRLHDRGWVRRQAAPCEGCDGAGSWDDGATICGECDGTGRIDADLPAELVAARFAGSHAHRVVWVIRFHLLDAPRLLGPSSRNPSDQDPESADAHGYTSNPALALRDEPEAVDAESLAAYAADAGARRSGEPGRREQELRKRARNLAGRLRQLADDPTTSQAAGELHAELDRLEEHLRVLEQQRRSAA